MASVPPNQLPAGPENDEQYNAPEPLPIKFSGSSLSSSEIPRERLLDPKTVLKMYRDLATESITKFALKLVHKAYFGPQIMKKCTVIGEQDRQGLPRAELIALKQAIFSELPRFWNEREVRTSMEQMC